MSNTIGVNFHFGHTIIMLKFENEDIFKVSCSANVISMIHK